MSRIKEFRERSNLTQEGLAKELGVTQSAVTKWETGAAMPRLGMMIKMSSIFGCTIDELLGISAG